MLYILLLLSAPSAHATGIDMLGANNPAIAAMWDMIRAVFPYSNMGGNGVTFVSLVITSLILRLIGAIAVVVLIYAGIRMITGGEEGLGEAKKAVTYALVGLVGALIADAVVNYVIRLVTLAVG
jgi:hypothetical protein